MSMTKRKLYMNMDFFTWAYYLDRYENRLCTPDDMTRLMEKYAELGIETVFWRLSACGPVLYHSQVEYQFDDDPRKHARALGRIMRRYDPLEEAIKSARKAGLRLAPWFTLFDDYFLGKSGRLVAEHPEWQWVDRTGKIYFQGVLSYAFPEVVAYRLEMIREIRKYGGDGLFLSLRSHADQSCPFRKTDMFGFEKPVVEEYKKRYGVDISKFDDIKYLLDDRHFVSDYELSGGEEFDRDQWHRLKGEFFTGFLEKVREEVGPETPVYICYVETEEYEGIHNMAQFHLDWVQWLAKGLVTALAPQFWINWQKLRAENRGDIIPAVIRTLSNYYEKYKKRPGKGEINCLIRFSNEADYGIIPQYREITGNLGFDGLCLYEAADFIRKENAPWR